MLQLSQLFLGASHQLYSVCHEQNQKHPKLKGTGSEAVRMVLHWIYVTYEKRNGINLTHIHYTNLEPGGVGGLSSRRERDGWLCASASLCI